MLPYKKSSLDDEDSISLLTSLLVRYPEVCSINYYPRGNFLKLTFILKDNLTSDKLKKFSDELLSCIYTYLQYERLIKPRYIKFNHNKESELIVMEITRDADTLTQKEINLMINLLRIYFSNLLVSDENPGVVEDNYLEQDDFIRYLLDNLKPKNIKSKIIALREEGRVLVFKQ